MQPSFSPTIFSEQLGARTGSVDKLRLDAIVGALLSLHAGSAPLAEMTTADFVADIRETVYSAKSPPELAAELFELRLSSLTNLPAVSLSGQAWELLSENAHNFLQSRIITDIRPIFDRTDNVALEGALVLHSLKITYGDVEGHHDFFVSLDNDDLQKLILTLQRAQAKAARAQALLEASNMPYHEIGGHETSV